MREPGYREEVSQEGPNIELVDSYPATKEGLATLGVAENGV